jgi:hypothetical protein
MNCDKVMDTVYEYSGEPMPLLAHLQVTLHLFLCPNCAQECERFELSREIMRTGFFHPSPDFEDPIMNLLTAEETTVLGLEPVIPGGLSTRGWVITGFIILVSLVSVFFGLDFNEVAETAGTSFLLPVGITIGIILTSYGALFIGSHLKELSERFGL